MENGNKLDFGVWKVPTKWEDITLKQFQEIERYYADKDEKFDARDVIHILCDKTVDEVNMLPMQFTEQILDKMLFLQEKPEQGEATNSITIDGEVYSINVMEKLKTGEYIALDSVLKNDRYDYSSFLAILCRKKGEIYDSKYEAELFEERKKMWDEQSVMKIFPIISFFLNLYMVSTMPTLLSLEVQEGLSHIRESIKNSRENGELSERSTRRLMKKLKKLEKSAKSI